MQGVSVSLIFERCRSNQSRNPDRFDDEFPSVPLGFSVAYSSEYGGVPLLAPCAGHEMHPVQPELGSISPSAPAVEAEIVTPFHAQSRNLSSSPRKPPIRAFRLYVRIRLIATARLLFAPL